MIYGKMTGICHLNLKELQCPVFRTKVILWLSLVVN